MELSSKFVETNGIRLAYAEWPGERGPVLCLPHLTGHKGAFARLAECLSPAYRVIAVDLRGRGDSSQPEEGYGFAYHARDLLGLADALGLDTFALLGHSFGATTATYLASVRPARVRALVLLDGGADPRDDKLQAMYPTIHQLDAVYPSLDAYLAAMHAVPYLQPWGDLLAQYFIEDVQVQADGSVRSKSSAAGIRRDLDQHFAYSMCLHFPAVRCPTLFVRPACGLRGDKGHVFSRAEAEAIVRHIPQGRLAHVAGVNHFTMVLHDDPPVVEPIRAFLEEVYGSA